MQLFRSSFLILLLATSISFQASAADNSISCEGEALSRESAKVEPLKFKVFSGASMKTADLAVLGGGKPSFIRGLEVIAPGIDGFSMASDKRNVNLLVERVAEGHVVVSGRLEAFLINDLVCRLD